LRGTWERDQQVTKCIGFDATEDHRMQSGGTYATAKGLKLCPRPDLPDYGARYNVVYPLREYGFNRPRCREIIVEAGLPVPPKSACFFCPAMRQIEILRLAATDPDMYQLAMAMETQYRDGRHFRGDTYWVVKSKHKETAETPPDFECFADSAADARAQFRAQYKDTGKPFKYKLRPLAAVPGLGRQFAWKDIPAFLGAVRDLRRTSIRT
jgi:hypothetical protein